MIVFVYRNLHKQCYSIRHKGIVIGHADSLVLANADFRVYEAGRLRVLKERRKNVHAFIVGELTDKVPFEGGRKATYNPYKYCRFVFVDSEQPVYSAKLVSLTENGIFINT